MNGLINNSFRYYSLLKENYKDKYKQNIVKFGDGYHLTNFLESNEGCSNETCFKWKTYARVGILKDSWRCNAH